MIGILIPGCSLITGGPITNNNVVVDVYQPKNISNIGLILNEKILDDYGAAMYFSTPPYETLQFLGVVANPRPSDIFYTGWSLNPNVNCFESIKILV